MGKSADAFLTNGHARGKRNIGRAPRQIGVDVKEPKLLECSFLIPVRRDKNLSDGRPHKRKARTWLDIALGDFQGGARAKDPLHGFYLDPDTGKRVWDWSKKYFVALPRRELDSLRSLLRLACVVFQQKSIYLSIAGNVEFVRRPTDETE